ncbi:MAG: response regulator [Deltaproteobacteria bacterium]|nr:response regulator [Deltaproteobacteria bacterium]
MSRNILVVDDCGTTRKLLSYMVRSGGFSSIAASNGIEAMAKMAQNDIHLIVTDLNMPQMDGLELIKAVRDDGNHKDVPIIMLTTEAEERDKRRGLEAGADFYLTKPVTTESLIHHIEKLLQVTRTQNKGG